MATLRLEIVTPEAKTYSDDVDSVVIPGVDGELGVYPRHTPLFTQIKPGAVRIKLPGTAEEVLGNLLLLTPK